MNCCSHCFKDAFLKKRIEMYGTEGVCNFCGSFDLCIDTSDLVDYFSTIFTLYNLPEKDTEYKHTESIWVLLQDDWQMFNLSERKQIEITSELIPNEDIETKKFIKNRDRAESLKAWEDFKEEVIYRNRYFPINAQSFTNKLLSFIQFLEHRYETNTSFYRSRITDNHFPIKKENMGKPPKEKTRSGRANPSGISYLYLASDISTAISETRPHVGHYVTVAQFNTTMPLKVIDLRNPKESISPFEFEEDALKILHSFLEFLCALGDELSRPVIPDKGVLDYVPSQYICEFIKSNNYDGVVYNSSLDDGYNIAIFDDDGLSIESTTFYKISSSSYTREVIDIPVIE